MPHVVANLPQESPDTTLMVAHVPSALGLGPVLGSVPVEQQTVWPGCRVEQKLPPRYDRHCRYLTPAEREAQESAGMSWTVRFAMPVDGETVVHDELRGDIVFKNADIDDNIILKSDGLPTYHLAHIVDDHLMGITHLIRAEEWISSAPRHWQRGC